MLLKKIALLLNDDDVLLLQKDELSLFLLGWAMHVSGKTQTHNNTFAQHDVTLMS